MRASEDVKSFDLLLDTVTNTFGGILFLAMLVVILLRITHKESLRSQQAVLREPIAGLESELQELLARRQQMRQALALQANIIRDLAPHDKREAFDGLQATKQTVAELAERRDQTLQQIVQTRNEIAGIAAELATLDQQREAANREVAWLKSKLKTEIESRTSTARPPRAHRTRKREIPIVVRYGRLYVPYETISDRIAGKLNTEDMAIIRSRGDELFATPKPYAGLEITDAHPFVRALSMKLASFDPGNYYIAVAIWEDSFEKFELVKRALINGRYEYRLIPVHEGGRITETHVADVLVH